MPLLTYQHAAPSGLELQNPFRRSVCPGVFGQDTLTCIALIQIGGHSSAIPLSSSAVSFWWSFMGRLSQIRFENPPDPSVSPPVGAWLDQSAPLRTKQLNHRRCTVSAFVQSLTCADENKWRGSTIGFSPLPLPGFCWESGCSSLRDGKASWESSEWSRCRRLTLTSNTTPLWQCMPSFTWRWRAGAPDSADVWK